VRRNPRTGSRAAQRRASDLLAPTPERLRHAPLVEQLARPIADDYGRPARPFRAVDTLAAMERRGSITAAMRTAGEDFRAAFQRAHLDPLHAAAFERLGYSPTAQPGLNVEAARESVWRTIKGLGGPASPAGSCLWHVVGLEETLKQWAIAQGWRRRPVDQETAAGILIAALGMLAGAE
jgi:hypothetical protein